MTTWKAIQNSIDAGGAVRAELDPLELDELQQLADRKTPVSDGVRYDGVTPDGDKWSVVVTNVRAQQ